MEELVRPSTPLGEALRRYLAETGYPSVKPPIIQTLQKTEDALNELSMRQLAAIWHSLKAEWPAASRSRAKLTSDILEEFLGDMDSTRWRNSHAENLLSSLLFVAAMGSGYVITPKKYNTNLIFGTGGVLGLAAILNAFRYYRRNATAARRALALMSSVEQARVAGRKTKLPRSTERQ
jgi:hypothetical protein